MSERPQGDEIDQELRSAMSDIAAVAEPAPEFDELFAPTLTLVGERTMHTNTRNVLIAAAVAVVAIVVGIVVFAPSDDRGLDTIDSPDAPITTLPDQDAATEEVDAPSGEVDAPSGEVDAPSAEVDTPSAEDLFGAWESENLSPQQTWTIVESGILVEGSPFVSSHTYSATGSTIELFDSGCGITVPGTYAWVIVDDVLTLTVVDDSCGRSDTLDGVTFQRVPSAVDLQGVWAADFGATWRIAENRIDIKNGVVPFHTYSATDSTIELKDTECGSDVPGTYAWVIVEDVLTFTVVEDACSRSDTLNGATFQRVG